ncbi:MAG: dUTP diphosphatase [Corynebacterium casei]|uniref:dUTP diphosphatase n=1 Tax=Corynebacterium casei TaxID=160386 RepID=UPI002647C948|nr:dUTP diphosphatase [Corynebacterium casei]MDN6286079.1 dUTP diphosphatase [Corynebacterium casei]
MKLKIVCDDMELLPTRAHPHDAGLDLRCAHKLGIALQPGERQLVDTGVAVNIPAGYVGLVHPRSGWAYKYGLTVNNAPGTIDAGFIGNVLVNLINHGSDTVEIEYGTRIAQLLIQRVELPKVELVDSLDTTARGTAGHGSTGVA